VDERISRKLANSRPSTTIRMPIARRCLRSRPAGAGVPPDPPRYRRFRSPRRGARGSEDLSVHLDGVRVAGGRVFPTAPPVGLSYGGVG